MMCVGALIGLLSVALLVMGLRAHRNEQEIRRLRRSGHRRMALRMWSRDEGRQVCDE